MAQKSCAVGTQRNSEESLFVADWVCLSVKVYNLTLQA